MGYKSKYSIGRILKTSTELKQDKLIAAYQRKLKKERDKKEKAKRPKIKRIKNKPIYESYEQLIKLKYKDFLLSKYWQYVRGKVLKRDKFKCVICSSKDGLQVHHDTYKNHFKELENLQDLMTLCSNCHNEHHYSN